MKRTRLGWAIIFAVIIGCGVDPEMENDSSNLHGYFQGSKVWGTQTLRVCWDDFDDSQASDRSYVRSRILDTWEKESGLSLVGWNECSYFVDEDIKIVVADENPHTTGIGTDLKWGEMVLNFTFNNFSTTACKASSSARRNCIGSNAIHEFGHALGMSHEHNRSDRDLSCSSASQGENGTKTVGSYDPLSIMNYCSNASYSNKISQGDIFTIRSMYGAPGTYYWYEE